MISKDNFLLICISLLGLVLCGTIIIGAKYLVGV